MINLVIAGHVCIDKNIIDGVRRDSWGSSAMYISEYFKKDNEISVKIISPYGEDFSEYSQSAPIINGVTDSKTLLYENIVKNGTRKQWCSYSTEITLPQVSPDVIASLKTAHIFMLAPMTPGFGVEYVNSLLNKLSEKCLKVLLPQGYFRYIADDNTVLKRDFVESSELIHQFHLVILSEDDATDSISIANNWSASHSGTATVVTQAEKGATYSRSGKHYSVNTIPIPNGEIANPVGGGDVFSGILATQLITTKNLQKAIRLANQKTAIYLRNTKAKN